MRLPRWRQDQKSRQRKKILIFFRVFLLFFFLLGFLLVASIFGRQLKSSHLPKDGRTTIVLASEPLAVVSFAAGGDLVILLIPGKAYVEVNRGFGSYRLGAVFKLGQQEKLAGQLLGETVQEFLAVPIDGWLGPKMEAGGWPLAEEKENLLNFKNNLTSWTILRQPKEVFKFWQNLETNLNFFDLLKFWWQVKSTRFDKIIFLNLAQTPVLSKLILADDSQALSPDFAKLDLLTGDLFKDNKIGSEHLSLEILNGTDKSGLANRVARLASNLGIQVIGVSNSSTQMQKECQIKGEAQVLKSLTANRLASIFSCQILANKPLDSRADLQIIIGQDYWQKLFSAPQP